MNKNSLFLFLVLFITNSCEKFETPSSGENSFYCEINGIPYTPERYGGLQGGGRPLYINYYDNIKKLKIRTYDIDTKYSIDIHLEYFDGEQEYLFYSNYEYSDPDLNNFIKITKGIIINGEVEISTYVTSYNPLNASLKLVEFKEPNKFIGSFNAILYNVNNKLDSIIVNNGKFNIDTETLN